MLEDYAIGCYYSFRRSLIVKAAKKKDKIIIQSEEKLNTRIDVIGNRLHRLAFPNKIWTQIHPSLNSVFHKRLNQIDFKDENAIAELDDIYLSLNDEGLLNFDENFNSKLPHHIKSLHLALKGLDYYRGRYDLHER